MLEPKLLNTLNAAVSAHIPGARLDMLPVNIDKNLRLALLNMDFPQHELDGENIQKLINEPMYWVFCWASGQVLANMLLDNPDWSGAKTVCDFGSGCGIVGIAAAMSGAHKVYACDIDPMALQAAQLNAELNGVELFCVNTLEDIEEPIDLITVADVLYDQNNLPLLDHFLSRAQHVLLADSRIKHFHHPHYTLLTTEESHTLPDLDESAEFRSVRIYEGQLKRASV